MLSKVVELFVVTLNEHMEIDLKSAAGLMAGVFILSALLKNAWDAFPNRLIPITNLVLGVPSYIVLLNGNVWSLQKVMEAIFIVAAAVGVHSGLKNTGEAAGVIEKPPTPMIIALGTIFLTGCKCMVMFAMLLAFTGCSTINPQTGQKEFDPVKTEKVRSAVKPLVTAGVAATVKQVPDAGLYFSKAAVVICEMRDTKEVSVINFRARLLGILDEQHVKIDPLIRTGFITIISVFDINFADRTRADLPPDQFVWNLLDVLCDGIRTGIAGTGQ